MLLSENTGREKLINDNIGLVHSCANRFRGRGAEYDDLFQAGCVGLVKAVDNYDVSRGFAFSTYAVPVILGEIKRVFRDGGSVKIGRTMKERSRKAVKVRDELSTSLGREPTIGEIAAAVDMDVASASELINASLPTVSLTGGEDGETQLDIPVSAPEEKLSESFALEQVIASLEEKDRRLIELRYFDGLTQTKTAAVLGMSQVQVSRREKSLLLKMRSLMLTGRKP